MNGESILRMAVAAPLHRYFDYLPPAGPRAAALAPGMRLWVPFGRGRRVAVLVERAERSELPRSRLKRAEEVLDEEPVLPADLVRLLRFAAEYYHQPPGEVFLGALPAALRRGAAACEAVKGWRLTDAGRDAAREAGGGRAPRQAEALRALETGALIDRELTPALRRALAELRRKGWAEAVALDVKPAHAPGAARPPAGPALTDEQQAAVDAVRTGAGFRVHLLLGITGSGKTEVYMRCIAAAREAGRQALVLVPEIALTPQLIGRFRQRFGDDVAVLHSALADGERLAAWRAARGGEAAIVVGTRSALFVPLSQPGLLILDEEHDHAYRQQEGVRYSARDLAVMRARELGVPLLLGSATPSLESLRHARDGRYSLLRLKRRVHGGGEPDLHLVDLTRHAQREGLSTPLVTALERHLADDGQVLLFLNRRGFAPALWCGQCGHVVGCRRCDARMTLHQADELLKCHHCGAQSRPPPTCPACAAELAPVGQGTERIERVLGALFPGTPIVRLDRDSVRRRGALEERLAAVRSGHARILVGTQMLTKGHDFPGIGLVGVLDADAGLFSSDFRASERLAQTIVQVAGRAGRSERAGQVLIQTRFPAHPLLEHLVREGYEGFARALLAEREACGWPPFTRLALLRAEAPQREPVTEFLQAARRAAEKLGERSVTLLGPAPSAMERRAGRYRHQLLLQAPQHRPLQRLLASLVPELEGMPQARRVRWTVDVDPTEIL